MNSFSHGAYARGEIKTISQIAAPPDKPKKVKLEGGRGKRMKPLDYEIHPFIPTINDIFKASPEKEQKKHIWILQVQKESLSTEDQVIPL